MLNTWLEITTFSEPLARWLNRNDGRIVKTPHGTYPDEDGEPVQPPTMPVDDPHDWTKHLAKLKSGEKGAIRLYPGKMPIDSQMEPDVELIAHIETQGGE